MTMPIQRNPNPVALPGDLIANIVIKGDLSGLNQEQLVQYYRQFCDRIGLDPISQPFKLLNLSGKKILYCDRSGAQQLNRLHAVSHDITARENVDGLYYSVTARASLPDGRHTESLGAVPVNGLTGEALCNAIMKAETKAKRRATLDLLGLGILDETEASTIPGAVNDGAPMEADNDQIGDALDKVSKCDTPDELQMLSEMLPAEVAENSKVVAAVNERLMSIRSKMAAEEAEKTAKEIGAVASPDALTELVPIVNSLFQPHKDQLRQKIADRAKDNGWAWSVENARFEQSQAPRQQAPKQQPDELEVKILEIIAGATGLDHLNSIQRNNADKIAASPVLQAALVAKSKEFGSETTTEKPAPITAPAVTAAPAPVAKKEQTAEEIIEEYKPKILACETPEALTQMLTDVNALPNDAAKSLRRSVAAKAKNAGWVSNAETKAFELAAGAEKPAPKEEKPSELDKVVDSKIEEKLAKQEAPQAETAGPAAKQQSLGWFEAHRGKKVWMEGALEGMWAGPYDVPDQDNSADYFLNTLQKDQNYLFRDLTEEEIKAAV